MNLTKAPKIDIRYGLQTQENKKEWVEWVFENLSAIDKNATENKLRSIAEKLFDEISLCGYEKGYDSARSEED
jgi:hypothetical protein